MGNDLIIRVNELGIDTVAAALGMVPGTNARRLNPCPGCGVTEARGAVHRVKDRWGCARCRCGGRAADLVLIAGRHTRWDAAALDDLRQVLDRVGVEPVVARAPVIVSRPSMTFEQVSAYWRGMHCMPVPRLAGRWLSETRGIDNPYACEWQWLGSRCPLPPLRPDLTKIAHNGGAVCWALRSMHPARFGRIANIQSRPLNRDGGPKNRLWVCGEGSAQDDGYPLCYGDPATEMQHATIILVEGGLDWMTAMRWAPDDIGVLGAYCAGDIRTKWERGLGEYRGRVVVVPHLDSVDKFGGRAGPDAVRHLAQLRPITIFDWRRWRSLCGHAPTDINDMVRAVADGGCGVDFYESGNAFREVIRGQSA